MKKPKNGPVNIRIAEREDYDRFKQRDKNRGPRNSFIAQANMIGDTRPMFGRDIVAFKGGEGGRNWSVRSTLV